jgi:hypothetical protein
MSNQERDWPGTCHAQAKRDTRKPEGKRLLGRPRCIWECTSIMYIKKTRYRAWIELIWLRIGATDSLLREKVKKLRFNKTRELIDRLTTY